MGEIYSLRTFGLYSALRACKAIVFRSRSTARLQVATIFLRFKHIHVSDMLVKHGLQTYWSTGRKPLEFSTSPKEVRANMPFDIHDARFTTVTTVSTSGGTK